MLSNLELSSLMDEWGTPPAGRRLVAQARSGKAAREVRSNGNNVCTLFFSRKMGGQIWTESRTIEFPAAVQYEHDEHVLEFYAQPFRLDVIHEAPGLRRQRFQHIPDFLVIRREGLVVDEWKPEARLSRLAEKSPGRILKLDDGWHFPAVEEILAGMGITYRLRTEAHLDRTYIENMKFLADFFAVEPTAIAPKALSAIKEKLEGNGVMHLSDLIAAGVERAGDE